jgi:hypothetical protein
MSSCRERDRGPNRSFVETVPCSMGSS